MFAKMGSMTCCSILIVLLWITCTAKPIFARGEDMPEIAKWYGNKKAAISLRFDDSLESHITYVIPLLNAYGIKATFMVNPGKERYVRFKNIWEKTVPASGHHLGNHTMHHHGARNLTEAEFEIGEASRTIWQRYPNQSKLQVFASGGGYKWWGGERWSNASAEYKLLMHKYHLIDLYDGAHPAYQGHAKSTGDELRALVQQAIIEGKHQNFVFHKVGRPGIMELMKLLIHGYDTTVGADMFAGFVKYLSEIEIQGWIAPLVAILKYETEYANAKLETITLNKNKCRLKLTIKTDPGLYDQNLTLIIPTQNNLTVEKITQNEKIVTEICKTEQKIIINVKPINSHVTLYYKNQLN